MHAVLNLKTDRTVSKDHETLKERLSQSSSRSFLVHDHWSELLLYRCQLRSKEWIGTPYLMITNENDLLAPQNERDHALFEDVSY